MVNKRKQLFDVCVRELKPSFNFCSHLEEETEYYEISARYTKSGKPVVVEFK